METRIVREQDWEHGLRCAECKQMLNDGDLYSERLSGFVDETPAVEIICVECALPSR